MKKIKNLVIFIFMFFSILSFSEEMKKTEYYVGDKIVLQISGDINNEEIKESLKDFKIFSSEKGKDNIYTVTFTSYSIGDKEIVLGDKKLKLRIASTLSDQEAEPYKELANQENNYDENDYPYLAIFLAMSGVTAILLSILLYIFDRLKNPYVIFKKGISKVNEENWTEKISLELRRYIDNVYNTNFLGGDYKAISSLKDDDIDFIQNMDYLKFNPNIVYSDDECAEYKKKAVEIVERVRKERKNSV